MSDQIEIPADKVRAAVCAAYDLSHPVGMGVLHYRHGPLDADTLDRIVGNGESIRMDYVHGRQCKFSIQKQGEKYFVRAPWYDHTDEDLAVLLRQIGETQ